MESFQSLEDQTFRKERLELEDAPKSWLRFRPDRLANYYVIFLLVLKERKLNCINFYLAANDAVPRLGNALSIINVLANRDLLLKSIISFVLLAKDFCSIC